MNNNNEIEETPNEISIMISKRQRKYLKMMHGQSCRDGCGCCPDLKRPIAPGPNENCMMFMCQHQFGSFYNNQLIQL